MLDLRMLSIIPSSLALFRNFTGKTHSSVCMCSDMAIRTRTTVNEKSGEKQEWIVMENAIKGLEKPAIAVRVLMSCCSKSLTLHAGCQDRNENLWGGGVASQDRRADAEGDGGLNRVIESAGDVGGQSTQGSIGARVIGAHMLNERYQASTSSMTMIKENIASGDDFIQAGYKYSKEEPRTLVFAPSLLHTCS